MEGGNIASVVSEASQPPFAAGSRFYSRNRMWEIGIGRSSERAQYARDGRQGADCGRKNIIPKNFAPRGTQSGAELIRTLERQNSAGDFEKSISFGIFRGSANLLPVLCGGSSRLSLRGMARASVSHIAAPQEPEIQSEPQGEDARFPRVGSYLGPAEYGAEFQEKKAAERDG